MCIRDSFVTASGLRPSRASDRYGTPENATLVYVLYMYQNAFVTMRMGYAAAMAWVLFAIVAVLTLFVFKYIGGRVHYEDAT